MILNCRDFFKNNLEKFISRSRGVLLNIEISAQSEKSTREKKHVFIKTNRANLTIFLVVSLTGSFELSIYDQNDSFDSKSIFFGILSVYPHRSRHCSRQYFFRPPAIFFFYL